ncbi:N-acetyl-1-D-myo-inositol-2-amino-2-deoxy-alpha-D-glucopyranoside deacetylase [Microlunatus antarcticus]|uniref:N-acetyl-1-D-myo-inositol-2-amino-2-deoxy-alpha-D-glucopyranoside deacetylase n=1 Tax=Microlunatus antarcticus TaxID=53388 RepID=A0A7W5P8C7_9ACTN|nr:N-acetyl-1-D-myo-inositol-2-amino-2-deoxy-alpha-D-glucopyranoside deacetylase [Microlunatus antarcticus]
MIPPHDRRLMLVHAHPDDETIGNGVTMARTVADGGRVTLVTCTLGEEGEVLIPELVHLDAEHEDALAPQRLKELTEAMSHLGVTDFVRLGGDGRFRDSGMAYDDQGRAIARDVLRDGIFWTADLLEASNEVVALIRDRRPQVLVAYNEIGGYGHPDHVQAHRVAMYGYLLAGVPGYRPDLGEPWTVARVLWSTMSASRMSAMIKQLREAGDTETFAGWDDAGDLPMVSSDADIAAVVDGTAYVAQKLDAMRAHATQIRPDGTFFAGGKMSVDSMWSHEFYRFAAGTPFPAKPDGADGGVWADDLFAGLG